MLKGCIYTNRCVDKTLCCHFCKKKCDERCEDCLDTCKFRTEYIKPEVPKTEKVDNKAKMQEKAIPKTETKPQEKPVTKIEPIISQNVKKKKHSLLDYTL